MTISRRKALSMSGSTLAGLSFGVLRPEHLLAAQARGQEDWPDQLVERPLRDGFPAPLPLNADGSAPEHPASAAGPITDPLMWRTEGRQTPEIEFDYREMRIKVDTRVWRHAPARCASRTLSSSRPCPIHFSCSAAHPIPAAS